MVYMRKTWGPWQPFLKGSLKNRETHTRAHGESPVCVWALFDLYKLSLWVSECTSERHRAEPAPVWTPFFLCSPPFVWGLRETGAAFSSSLCLALTSALFVLHFPTGHRFGLSTALSFFLHVCTHVTSMKLERGERIQKVQRIFFFLRLFTLLGHLWWKYQIMILENY